VATTKERPRLAVFLGTCKLISALHNKFLDTSCSANKRNPREKKTVGLWKESAFHDVKRAYTIAPVLKIADPALEYVMTTDASDVGIGAVVEQEYDGVLHPVVYASRKLNSAEQNYPTHDRGLLATMYVNGDRTCIVRG
jgi:RNase H-like domain found in reverse transcriptase